MKTTQKKKNWEKIITSVIFYAYGQIRMGYYDVQKGVFVQFTATGNLQFYEHEVEEWFRVLYK